MYRYYIIYNAVPWQQRFYEPPEWLLVLLNVPKQENVTSDFIGKQQALKKTMYSSTEKMTRT